MRGFDRKHRGIMTEEFTITLDGGCGFGGPLLAGCIERNGSLAEVLEA